MDKEPVVRFNKRRKIHRRREDEGDEAQDVSHYDDPTAHAQPHHDVDDDKELAQAARLKRTPSPPFDTQQTADISVAELLRRRKQARARRGGIEFSNSSSKPTHSEVSNATAASNSQTLVAASPPDDTPKALEAARSRFAPQTGTVAEAHNQHMMAFIASEMERLRAGAASSDADNNKPISDASDPTGAPLNLPHRQPAALGQIQEIDLGPDAAMRNIAMTEAATRRLQNGQPLGSDENGSPQKVRLGRDGKPRKPRKRRGSDDMKRDQVVEAVLRENRIELYDESGTQQPGGAAKDDAVDAADDIIAEQFQRDFLEAIQSRNRMRRAPAQTTTAKKGALEEKSRGPKLGGSRSARAAMHAAEKAKTGKR